MGGIERGWAEVGVIERGRQKMGGHGRQEIGVLGGGWGMGVRTTDGGDEAVEISVGRRAGAMVMDGSAIGS